MTNNRPQFNSPETRPETERRPMLTSAINKILDVLDRTYNIEQSIAKQETAEERPFVLRAIDYTIKPSIAEATEPQPSSVTFPSSIQHNLIIQAETLVDRAYDEAA